MANLGIEFLEGNYPLNSFENERTMSLQIHITRECDQNCIHCYFKNTNYTGEDLTKEEWIKLIDEFYLFLHSRGSKRGLIAITGGDPLMTDVFWIILSHIQESYKFFFDICVMGNPYHVTKQNAIMMKNYGVYQYQISLDGLEDVHDFYRKKGSFKESIKALNILKKAGIKTVVAMTVSKTNSKDIIPLLDYLNRLEVVDIFGIDKMIPIGNGFAMKSDLFSPLEYRDLLFSIFTWEVINHPKFEISKKDSLWKLLLFELGLIDPIKESGYTGCFAGIKTMGVMPDGTMLACTKLMKGGEKYPKKSLESFIINNRMAVEIALREKNKKCKNCELLDYCGGCPAMKFATTGDVHGTEPYCWK